MDVKVRDLSFRYDKKIILDKVSLKAHRGEFIGIVGPNGCGKSTFLKMLYKSLIPESGKIEIKDKDFIANLHELSQKEVAKFIAVIPQELDSSFGFTSSDIVAMGRSPHLSGFSGLSKSDINIIAEAMEATGASRFSNREFSSLSGGEKKRVMIARAIAQKTPIMLLDEPTNHLDLSAMYSIMEVIRSLDATIIAVLHDLNLALEYCDRVVVFKDGKVFADGPPKDVLHSANIYDVFGVYGEFRSGVVENQNRIVFSATAKNVITVDDSAKETLFNEDK